MSAVRRFRKRPVVVEAMQFTDESKDRCFNWVRCSHWAGRNGRGEPTLVISTLEGDMVAELGDWIVCGAVGEFYPCKDSVFRETYEEVGS